MSLRYNGKFINLSMIGSSKPSPEPVFYYNEGPTLVEYADSTSASLDIVGEASRSNLTGWANVKRVLFGNTVTSIAANLFRNSANLKYAYTGWNCSTVGERSFNDCSIQDVVFGPGIRVIGQGQYAFSGATRLSSMTFHPDSQLSAVGYGAVRTTGLKELSVCSDSSSLAFGQWSFSNNQDLSVLVLDVQTVPSLDYSPIASPRGTLDGCPHLTSTSYDGSIVVPDALKDSFLSDSRWSDIPSSKFVAMSEWTDAGKQSFITSCFYNSQLIWGGGEEKPDPLSALYRRWNFDTPYDSVAGIPMTLYGNAHLDNGSLVINGNGSTHVNYAQLSGNNFPTEYDGGITIEFWQNTSTRRDWSRIFDFGTGETNFTCITTTAGSANTARAAVNFGSGESHLDSTYMTPGQRWHAAVVYDLTSQSGKTLLSVCTFDPSGNMTMSTATWDQDMAGAMSSQNINYLGRSFYSDADFTGFIYDFKIWSTMLSEEQLRALDSAGPDALPQ